MDEKEKKLWFEDKLQKIKQSEEKRKHFTVIDYDRDKGGKLDYKIDTADLFDDIKFLIKDYYVALFEKEKQGLKLTFNNGQSFLITLKEITDC